MSSYAWWQTAVGYQLYPRSFQDTNGDGIGDLAGIRQRLPYLKELGIDFIWLNPIYQSPNFDNGYDISDFYTLHPDFGTLDELKTLLTEAHALDIKIIMDLVLNHTSDQHPWFQAAKASRTSPYRDFYHWHDAQPTKAPNDWQSFFGGSTWTYDPLTKQSYFHIFAKEQPDLNWTNPLVRQEMYKMIRWWLDFGVDGFRLDAISHLQKASWDVSIATTETPWVPFMNVPGIELYLDELKEIFASYNVFTVGEASGVTANEAVHWTGPDGYFDVIFELEHTQRIGEPGRQVGSLAHLRSTLYRWQTALASQGWNALYLENHDTPRSTSVFVGNRSEATKGLAVLLLTLRGTPFIYQGQEIGMQNFPFQKLDEIDATDTLALYQRLHENGKTETDAFEEAINWSRDHSRTPMQWDASAYAGFSPTSSWMPVHPNAQERNVSQQQQDPHSLLHFYQELISLRKGHPGLVTGTFAALSVTDETVFAYTKTDDEQRETWLVLINLGATTSRINLPEAWQNDTPETLLASHELPTNWQQADLSLPAEGYWILKKTF